jgi:ankyrin repeat protein
MDSQGISCYSIARPGSRNPREHARYSEYLRSVRIFCIFSGISKINGLSRSRSLHIQSVVATCNENTIALYDLSTASFKEISSRLHALELAKTLGPGSHISCTEERTSTLSTEYQSAIKSESWASMKFYPMQRRFCRAQCYCRCHSKKVSRIRIAPFNSIIGSLAVIYSGFTIAGQYCDIPSCRHFRVCMVEATYSFPRWTFSLSVIGGIKLVHGYPTAGLTVQRRITKDSRSFCILDACRFKSSTELKSFLQQYPGSIHDVDSWNSGAGVLDYAIGGIDGSGRHHYENTNVLLAFGADPFATDDYGRSAAMIEIITLTAQKCMFPLRRDLLPSMTDFDNYDLSHLTKVILGFRPLDIQTELNKAEFRHCINEKDGTGLTPLHWAITMGDSFAVHHLIEAGADTEVVDAWNTTPLTRACMRLTNASCIEELIRSGADFTRRSQTGYLPIHVAAGAGQSDGILTLLIEHGSNVQDSGTLDRDTPLTHAAFCDRDRACKFLLAHGAQIDSEDWEGDTPLFEAIRTRSHRALTALLDAGANVLHVNHNDCTILHRIAISGNKRTISIMSKVFLAGLNWEAKDRSNRTAREYMQMRSDLPDGFLEAFNQLVDKIEKDNLSVLEAFESDSEDDFVDALDHMSSDDRITQK